MALNLGVRTVSKGIQPFHDFEMVNRRVSGSEYRSHIFLVDWEDQFRVVPPAGGPMIVVVKTKFTNHVFEGGQLLALLDYELQGESYFPDPVGGTPRKATLKVSGSCSWNTSLGLPHSLRQTLEFRIMDYELIRSSGDLLEDETLATISSVTTDIKLGVKSKTREKEKTRAPLDS